MKLTAAGALILVAMSIPIALELRTFFGFFSIEVPIVVVAIVEALFVLAVLAVYDGSKRASRASH
ncbi:CbaC protein [Haladaptatus sp. W1]|uniref:CbaC protein n=1 Tax=Haladaptatus sp. W1 TaxID=1897478 RepID=UPI000849B9C5|nr:CbaC protein [Haladaptatus sp. W1]ODR80993.1 CbaC protein [Haladaptatus sp. W1]ODR83551.1 CbaC protein [Haladaptatus sp. W1]